MNKIKPKNKPIEPTQHFGESYSDNQAENYQRYFVPVIPKPLAIDLVETARLAPGQRVLDVACGTGVVTRLAAERVGPTGVVAGTDINLAMLDIARSIAPDNVSIAWHETPAETLPFADEAFEVVLSQLSLPFFSDKPAALQEMFRVLRKDGRMIINVPGSIPPLFTILAEGLAKHINPDLEGFVHQVFALHDRGEFDQLVSNAGFRSVSVQINKKKVYLPAPREFLWQYIHSTPLAGMVMQADAQRHAALEQEIIKRWQPFVNEGSLICDLEIVVATARK